MKEFKLKLAILLLFTSNFAFSQELLRGRVLDAADSTALAAVSVYYDGTSIGTVTGMDGFFSIEKYAAPGSVLVIRLLGYEPLMLKIPEATGNLGQVLLRQQTEELEEVVIEPDPWSRKKKLQIFKREFLGSTAAAQKCRIKNEEALRLVYSPSTETLSAEATQPLLIVNRHLGYEIEYGLTDFKVQFSTGSSGLQFTHMVYYEGTSFFRETGKKTRKKLLNNREKSYKGSPLHFMRSLAKRQLSENNFRIFHEKFEVPPYHFFDITTVPTGTLVELKAEKISILYGELEQSGMETAGAFLIDSFGNHYPPNYVTLSGEMSHNRIAHLLPLDYQPE